MAPLAGRVLNTQAFKQAFLVYQLDRKEKKKVNGVRPESGILFRGSQYKLIYSEDASQAIIYKNNPIECINLKPKDPVLIINGSRSEL